MKKKLLLLILPVLLISGCQNQDKSKNLRCEKSEIVSENTYNQVITATFEDNQIKTSDIKIETLIAEKYVPYIDSLEEDLKTKYEDYYNKQGIDINMSVGTSSITLKINIDFNLIDNNSKALLGVGEIVSTYEETKKLFEQSGYKCN